MLRRQADVHVLALPGVDHVVDDRVAFDRALNNGAGRAPLELDPLGPYQVFAFVESTKAESIEVA
jgi:hypothetical protein